MEFDNLISQDLLVLEDDEAENITQQEEMERNANRQELPLNNNRGAAGGAVLAHPPDINNNRGGRQLGAIPKVAYQ